MKMFTFVAAASCLALSATGSFAQGVSCTPASLKGQCTFQAVGAPSTVGAQNGVGPNAIVGQMIFDGAGNVAMDQHANVNGTYYENEKGAGTYTINPDCDGVLSITFPIPGGSRTVGLTFVLSQSGQTLRTINNSSTQTPSGPLYEVEAGICRFGE